MDDKILEPLKAYNEYYKKEFDENAKKYFDELVKKSSLDVEQNRATVKEYNQEVLVLNNLKSKLSRHKALFGFMIFFAVAGFIMFGLGIYFLVQTNITLGATFTPLGLILAVVGILVAVKTNSKIKQLKEECNEQDKIANEIKAKAWAQMSALNKLFESSVTKTLIESTVPLIKIDDNFDMRRFDYLSGKYGLGDNDDFNRSTIDVLTGEIIGNPFVVDREIVQSMGTKTYTGSIVITWTTTYTDSEGNVHTQHHSQTLVATVTKPIPIYSEQTRLIYGNEAAPDLSFSRAPSHAEKLSERELENKIKSGVKKIQRKQEKQLGKSVASFTGMGNEEFDVLFGALDRDNEVQFRLLFTPLAQKNMLALMTDKENYGDDFYFHKYNNLNVISSEHSSNWDLDTDCRRYYSYDVDKSQNEFLTFNRNYFKSLFFDLAPLLSIPLYQQHKPREYIYKEVYDRNYTSYESEYAVNKMGQKNFCNPLSRTQAILKTDFVRKDGKSDDIDVYAYSFTTENRVDLVPRLGGDGYMHNVPVHWIEYIPVQQTQRVKLKQLNLSDKEFNQKLGDEKFKSTLGKYAKSFNYSHGILCCVVDNENIPFDKDIDEVLQ